MINKKVLIIISKYYKDISENLLKSAVTFLEENSIVFDVIEVPGALEIPQVLNFQVNNSNNLRFAYEGYIALGCVIKGETYHFEIEIYYAHLHHVQKGLKLSLYKWLRLRKKKLLRKEERKQKSRLKKEENLKAERQRNFLNLKKS